MQNNNIRKHMQPPLQKQSNRRRTLTAAALTALCLGATACTGGDTTANPAQQTKETAVKQTPVAAPESVQAHTDAAQPAESIEHRTSPPTGVTAGAPESTELHVDQQILVRNSSGTTTCAVTTLSTPNDPTRSLQARCITDDAPTLEELPHCVPSPTQQPMLAVHDGHGHLDCTTQGLGREVNEVLVPEQPWTYQLEGTSQKLTLRESANGIIALSTETGPVGEIGPGVLTYGKATIS